jgi:hypothetical protein
MYQVVFLFGGAILAFACLRLWLPEHRTRDALVGTATRILTIGVGFLVVVGAALAFFASTGALVELLRYALVVPLLRYDPPFLVTGHVYMTLSLLVVWPLAIAMIARSLRRLRTRQADEATLFIGLWAVFVAYPGLTQYSGDHKMLFTFPAVALLAAAALRLAWHTPALRARLRSLVARARGRSDATVSVLTVVAVLFIAGMVVATVGFNAMYASNLLDENIADQRAEAQQVGQYVDGPVYSFPFFWETVYFNEDVSLPDTHVGGVYTDGLAQTVIGHLEEERLEYVVVPAGHVTDAGSIEGNRFFSDTDSRVGSYIETHYEPVAETDDYVVYRRHDTES